MGLSRRQFARSSSRRCRACRDSHGLSIAGSGKCRAQPWRDTGRGGSERNERAGIAESVAGYARLKLQAPHVCRA